jgi:putative CocE/NonD family hydrolase
MIHRNVIAVFLFIAVILHCVDSSAVEMQKSEAISQPEYSVIYEGNLQVPMRDGVLLSADVWRPAAEGRFPVILIRTPYSNNTPPYNLIGRFYAACGYVYVAQDCRGRYDSGGIWRPELGEDVDGYDTVEWCASQPWSNGKVGMRGLSYMGYTQWAAAVATPPHLVCLFSYGSPSDFFLDCWHMFGTLYLMDSFTWAVTMDGHTIQDLGLYEWKDDNLKHLPLTSLDEYFGRKLPYWKEWLSHPTYDDYWRAQSVRHLYGKITVPAVSVSGWYDDCQIGTIVNYSGMVEKGGSELARGNQHLILGYWRHLGPYPDYPAYTALGEMDFGSGALFDMATYELRWFDHWLKGIDNGIDREPKVKIFVMGENRWREENEWPLARARHTPYYFHSGGSANSLNGDGKLDIGKPAEEKPDVYKYDPANPVLSLRGGTGARGGISADPIDQRPTEERKDVLVYTSEALTEDLEVTGPVEVILYAASSACDTDFCAKLVDVHPDGRVLNVCYPAAGIISARFRNGTAKAEPIEPGKVYRYEIVLRPTSIVFKKGHRIRVEVSSSDFPMYNRNLNTGLNPYTSTEMVAAVQTIYHDAERPSHILLPLIPPERRAIR